MANTGQSDILNPAKARLQKGEVVSCMSVRLVDSVEIVRIAKAAGFDSIYVDLEHSSFSLREASLISIAALDAGLPCFVRVPANTPDYISRALDGGAVGIIAPDVGTAEEARAVVAAAKYPPAGRRSIGSAVQLDYAPRMPADDQLRLLNDATLVVIQLESQAAIDNCREIVAVEGVDLVLIGSNDLLADFGAPGAFDDPRLLAAYDSVIDACRGHGCRVGVGGLASRPDLMAELVRRGVTFVSAGTDVSLLKGAAGQQARQVREMAPPAR